MTTSFPVADIGVTRASFGGVTAPPQIAAEILNLALGGSPFSAALTRWPTSNAAVAFPRSSPEGAAWVPEGGLMPLLDMNDTAKIIAVAKLAGVITVSNESWRDAAFPLLQQIGQAVSDSYGPKLDDGMLHGSGAAGEPQGVIASIDTITAPSLFAGVIEAIATLASNGGTASTLFVNPAAWSAEASREQVNGPPIYENGVVSIGGTTTVIVPMLRPDDGALAVDTSRAYLIEREAFTVEISDQVLFLQDSTAVKVAGRFACGMPYEGKSAMRVLVDTEATAAAPTAAKSAPARKATA
jgi:HK97 family phage major capsid protein